MRISDWSSDVCSSDLCAKSLFSANGGGHRSNVGIMGQKHQPRNDPLFLFAEVHCHDIGAVFIRRSVVFGSLMRLQLFARDLHLKLKSTITGWIDKRREGGNGNDKIGGPLMDVQANSNTQPINLQS